MDLDKYYLSIYIQKRLEETDMPIDVTHYCWMHKHTLVITSNKQETLSTFLHLIIPTKSPGTQRQPLKTESTAMPCVKFLVRMKILQLKTSAYPAAGIM